MHAPADPTRRSWMAGLVGLALACRSSGGGRRPLTVAAAMSLSEAMTAYARDFEGAHADLEILLDLAGSQALAAQILAGAAVDVFVSADLAQLDRVVRAGLAEAPTTIASNRLVVIAGEALGLSEAADLAAAGRKVVLCAPEVPAGAYARAALDRLGLRAAVEARVVSEEENVRAVVQKVSLGEADAGIVYATDVRTAAPGALAVIELPGAESIRATYHASPLRGARDPASARAFVAGLREAPAQAIFADLGFGPP